MDEIGPENMNSLNLSLDSIETFTCGLCDDIIKDIEEYKAKAHIVSQAVLYNDQIAITHWNGGLENTNTVAAQAADELLDIEGIHASFVLSQVQEVIFISARSLGDINVQVIMEKMGGGGHLMMAGAQLRNMTMDEALVMLKTTIEAYMQERR